MIGGIYTEIKKAFDTVNHSILLNKFYQIWIHASLLSKINSYLNDIKQFVRVPGAVSNAINITSGAPQGSQLISPLLFNMFINDIPDILRASNSLMFADNLLLSTFYYRLYNSATCIVFCFTFLHCYSFLKLFILCFI